MKIGIMGGTFDPVHNAHLTAASKIRELCGLDEVVLMPTNIPPHKSNRKISSAQQRLAMLNLALETVPENSGLRVSTIELDRLGTTYTVDTLKQIVMESHTEDDFYYIIGADVVFDLINWKDCTTVFQLCSFIAMMRPGFNIRKFDEKISELRQVHSVRISTVEMQQMNISSTELRNHFAHKTEWQVSDQLPPKVFEYILENKLYRA